MLKSYYHLTKPGIIRGNLITAAMGFFLASHGHIKIGLFIELLIGIALVIASACVINNYIDRDIDRNMQRTKNRALVTGEISGKNAIFFGTAIGLIGFGALIAFSNLIVLLLGALAWIFYVAVYGYYKRKSVHGTLIGTISGSIPPVAGYCAISNRIDLSAILLFIVMVCWQMAHFYAIAIYRIKDYKAAGVPVLPIIKGISKTRHEIILFIAGFIVSVFLLGLYDHRAKIFAIFYVIIGLSWLAYALNSYSKKAELWAKKVFIYSLSVIMLLALTLSVSSFFS